MGFHKPSPLPFTCVYSAVCRLQPIRVVFISVNQVLGHWTQASCLFIPLLEQAKIICFASFQCNYFPVHLFSSFAGKSVSCFSWRSEKLYLASREGTTHHSYAATSTRQVDPPKCAAIHRSNCAGSSLSREPSFPLHATRITVDWGSENARTPASRAKTSTVVNQQPNRANASTATQRLRVKISARVRCKLYDTWSRTQCNNQAGRLTWTLFKPKLHQTITFPLNGHLCWSCLTRRAPREPRKLASPRLSRTSRRSTSRK